MARAQKIDLVENHIKESSFMVWGRISPELLSYFDVPPDELLGHARLILAGYKGSGDISYFHLFVEKFHQVWSLAQEKGLTRDIHILLGIGIPSLPGLKVMCPPPDSRNQAALVTIKSSPEEVQAWHPRWLEQAINDQLEKWKKEDKVNYAQVMTMWCRSSKLLEKIENYPLSNQTHYNPMRRGRAYWVRIYEDRQEVELLLGDVHKHSPKELINLVLKDVHKMVNRLAISPQNKGLYRVLDRHIAALINMAYSGPQQVGYHLPISVACAFSYPKLEKNGLNPLFPFACINTSQMKQGPEFTNRFYFPIKEMEWQETKNFLKEKHIRRRDPKSEKNGALVRGYISYAGENKAYCRESMRLGQKALLLRKDLRHFNSLSLCLNEQTASEFFQIIQNFKLQNIPLVSEPGDQLWQLNFQVFPLTCLGETHKPLESNPEEVHNLNEKHWCFIVLKEMVGFPRFQENPEMIARKLYPEISPKEVSFCLKQLLKMKLIERREGRLYPTQRDLILTKLTGQSVRDYHRSSIDLAIQSGDWGIKERSDIFSITFSATKRRINLLRDRLLILSQKLFDAEKHVAAPDQIYQVNFQMFCLVGAENKEAKVLLPTDA